MSANHAGTRRDLLKTVLAAAAVPCCTLPEAPAAIEGKIVRIDLDKTPDLRPTGSAVRIVDPKRKIALLVAHPTKHEFIALSQTCTHGGGPLTYIHKHRRLQCTCWGHARFGLDGQVLFWPNSKPGTPLRLYPVARKGSVLEVLVEDLA